MTSANDTQETLQPEGCLNELVWIGAGFFQPCFNLAFYQRAIKRGTFLAIGFFLLFEFIVSLVTTINLSVRLNSIDQDIREAFSGGAVPVITISGGVASVSGPQPWILVEEEGTLVAIDTTGDILTIDQSQYYQGFLLTRRELHVLSDGEYQVFSLADIQQSFDRDPIVINEETAGQLWGWFTGIFSILALVVLGFWNLIVRLMFLTFLAVILWGLTSLSQTEFEFGEVLTMGIYAMVPATYLSALLGLLGIQFFGFLTLIGLVVWGFVLVWIHLEKRPAASGELGPPGR